MGYCLDSGTARSVIRTTPNYGIPTYTSHPTQILNTSTLYSFSSSLMQGKGLMTVRMPLADGHVIYFWADIVDGNISSLIRLNVSRYQGLLPDFYYNELRARHSEWALPINYSKTQAFLLLNMGSIFFTWPELTRLHPHFFHLSTDTQFQLICRSDPSKVTSEV